MDTSPLAEPSEGDDENSLSSAECHNSAEAQKASLIQAILSPPPLVQVASSIHPFERPDTVEAQTDDSFWKVVEGRVKQHPTDEEIGKLASGIEESLAKERENGKPELLAFDKFRNSSREKFVKVETVEEISPIWFVGDLHGDRLGLESSIQYIDSQSQLRLPTIIFLGDLFDRGRGEHSAVVLFRVLSLLRERPGRIGFIVGNHDDGLKRNGVGTFTSSVGPGEFAEWLNTQARESPWIRLAEAAIKFFADAPRALLLPGGLLVAHGGVPHSDLQNGIIEKEDLDEAEMLDDFVWTRLHETAKKRQPNRTTRGCSLGICDFNAFCERAAKVLKSPIRGMIRGHDHFDARFRFFNKYEAYPVLTINTICYRLDGEMPRPLKRPIVTAQWQPDKMPVVHILETPGDLVAGLYPP